MRRDVAPAAAIGPLCGLLVLLWSVPSAAQAAGEPSAPALVFRWFSETLGPYPAAAVIFLGLPVLGALGKWLIDQLGAKRAKQRDFVENTGKRVVDLAWTHYWALANATGMLARPLTQHLRMVDAHLLVYWHEAASLESRMREIADETARASFVPFVRLLHAFERFQFRGSNTYLLPHHAAGEALRRLYNRFVESLGDDLNRSLTPIRLAVERKLAVKDKDGRDDPRLDLGSAQFDIEHWFTVKREDGRDRRAAADWSEADLAGRLDTARTQYVAWLRGQPQAVAEAADSLHAFSRLLTHELATLHAVWHRDRGPFALQEAWRQADAAVGSRAWPGVLDSRAVEAIRRTRSVSSFFSPLGLGTRTEDAPPEPTDIPTAAKKDETRDNVNLGGKGNP